MTPDFSKILFVFLALSMAGAVAGIWLGATAEVARRIVPLSGAVLLVLSVFWILPELAAIFGWQTGPALMLAGFGFVWFIDRFVTPVCPSCSHTHDHDHCSTRLHGFAAPLITAALIHSFFDGWTLVAGQTFPGALSTVALAVLVHKIPESLAYGVILKSALRSRAVAVAWALAAQIATVAGTLLALAASSRLGGQWMGVLLALGGGTFLYLGVHAVHGEWRRRAAVRIG